VSKRLYCPKCDNTGRFSVPAKEYHTWIVDGSKNFIADNDCGDSEMGSEFQCESCGEWVAEHDFCDKCDRVLTACGCESNEHETRVRVEASFYINIGTQSHPDDVPEETMKDILAQNAVGYLHGLNEDSVFLLIDNWQFDEIKKV
jgi:hypothetical protein